jgi:hypothetical protein
MDNDHGEKIYFDEIDCPTSAQAEQIIQLLEQILNLLQEQGFNASTRL